VSGYVNITSPAGAAKFDHVWRAGDGGARASVSFGDSWITFGDPAAARAAATECLKAAEAMEALPPGPTAPDAADRTGPSASASSDPRPPEDTPGGAS